MADPAVTGEEQQAAKVKQVEAAHRGAEGGRGNKKTLEMNPSQGFPKSKREPQVRTKLAKQLNVSEHKGQQAMAMAMVYPEGEKGGRGKLSTKKGEFSKTRLLQARVRAAALASERDAKSTPKRR